MFQLSTSRRRNPAVSLLLLLLTCTSVSAVPLSNYHQNIKRAIETLEALTKIDEDEADVNDIENQFVESSRSVRSILPQHQTVEFDGDSYNVDNSWLHKSLDELDRSADRSDKIEKILNRPEYATGKHGANALARLLQDIANWLEKLLPKRNISVSRVNFISVIARIVVLAIAALVIAYVLKIVLSWFVGHSSRPKRRKIKEPRIVLGEKLEPDATATDLLAEAEALARQGDLRAAIRKAYIALLVELGDRKLVSLAHHKTNRDYLNFLRTQPPIHSRMRGLTESFERHWYGFASATPNDWQDFRAGYVAALQSETN